MTAREEAERRWTRGFTGRGFAIEHFVQGAAWALEETDERVEAMARSSFEFFGDPYELEPWDDVSEKERRAWLEEAREVLAALRRVVL